MSIYHTLTLNMKGVMKDAMEACTPEQREEFKQAFTSNASLTLNEVIDKLPDDKMEEAKRKIWSMLDENVERVIQKANAEKAKKV